MNLSLWRRLLVGGALSLLVAVMVFVAVSAQGGGSCTVSGYVLDPRGRAVPQATVILRLSGRDNASQVVSAADGSYSLAILPPALTALDAGYLYIQLPLTHETLVGALNFKNCRARRDIFTNTPAGPGFTPGPTPPVPPPVVPAYPAPNPPSPVMAKSLAFFDLTALPRGGVSPGDNFAVPICVAAFEAPLPQITKLTFIAEFDPARLRVKGFRAIDGSPFSNNPIRAAIQRETVDGRERGRIWYEVDANAPVELPLLPAACTRVVDVEMEAIAGAVQAGDTVGLSTVKGLQTNPLVEVDPSMRIGGADQIIARSTTYVDILTPEEQSGVQRTSYLPVLIKGQNLR